MVQDNFGDGHLGMSGWYLWTETANPQQPIALSLDYIPVSFVSIGEQFTEPIPIPQYNYLIPRISDPCPDNKWGGMTFPSKEQNITFLKALEPFANVREVLYLPHWTIVDLEFGYGRVYEANSLPGIGARKTALYHYAEETFYKSMGDMTRERRIDPSKDLLAPTRQDSHNYLRDPLLSPACWLECALTEGVNSATSTRVKIQRPDGADLLTVAYHGFLISQKISQPFAADGGKLASS